MLFWISIILLFVGIGLIGIYYNDWKEENKLYDFARHHEDLFLVSGSLITIVTGFALVVMLCTILSQQTCIDAEIEKKKETYNAITYKVESGVCRDELGLLNKEVIDEVQSWNEDVRWHQEIQDDFWIGIFYPNVYDQLETIDYEKFQN